jgi:hypothetical protein
MSEALWAALAALVAGQALVVLIRQTAAANPVQQVE